MSDYELLGVTKTSTLSEVKAQYRMLCKIYHPDNVATGDAEKFKQINEAYKRVTDKINSNTVETYEHTIDFQGILDDYIKYALDKYKSVEEVTAYLRSYIEGNLKAITRDNNFRDLFGDYLSPQTVINIMNGDIYSYVYQIHQAQDPAYDTFMDACKATYIKYGKAQLIAALNESLKGNFSMFTNDGRSLRDQLKRLVEPNRILNFLYDMIGDNAIYDDMTLGEQAADEVIARAMSYSSSRTK